MAANGFSLVEVLVALFVLAIGVLATTALLTASLRNARSALLRTHAVNLVADLSERIRANAGSRHRNRRIRCFRP